MAESSSLLRGIPLPAPQLDGLDTGFWQACRQHELAVQRCSSCGALQHPPECICHVCLSRNFDWQKVSGRGVIYSYMIVAHPPHPALADCVPFNVILVQLDDAPDVRMVGNLIGCPNDHIYVGMPVEVCFEYHPEQDITLPLWKAYSQSV